MSGRYWEHKGKHQDLYNALFAKLVPQEGPAETPDGELLRAVSELYYDAYNNGGCNFEIYRDHFCTIKAWRSLLRDGFDGPDPVSTVLRYKKKAPLDKIEYVRAFETLCDRTIELVASFNPDVAQSVS